MDQIANENTQERVNNNNNITLVSPQLSPVQKALSTPSSPISPRPTRIHRSSSWTNIGKRCKTVLCPRWKEDECAMCMDRFASVENSPAPHTHNPTVNPLRISVV